MFRLWYLGKQNLHSWSLPIITLFRRTIEPYESRKTARVPRNRSSPLEWKCGRVSRRKPELPKPARYPPSPPYRSPYVRFLTSLD